MHNLLGARRVVVAALLANGFTASKYGLRYGRVEKTELQVTESPPPAVIGPGLNFSSSSSESSLLLLGLRLCATALALVRFAGSAIRLKRWELEQSQRKARMVASGCYFLR